MSDEIATSSEAGQAACPFVAFEDDRDHRAERPDYRHRCFAAAEPEPRATAHQERYCLSPAFAQCPIFLDWARQEAAGVVRGATLSGGSDGLAAVAPVVEAPAFLATRGRTTPAESVVAAAHSTSDPGSGLWGFEGAPKRTVAPAMTPHSSVGSSGSSLPGAPAYTMARRAPTHPDWENPPRLDNFPRLRARDDRNNQPLLLAFLGVGFLMVALILYPLITGGSKGGVTGSSPTPSGSLGSGGIVSATDTPLPTPAPDKTLMVYTVTRKDKSLSQIATDHQITLSQLELANPLPQFQSHNYNVIFAGMIIYIPWQSWTPPPAPTPTPTPTPMAPTDAPLAT
jgi:LysM repeat protein